MIIGEWGLSNKTLLVIHQRLAVPIVTYATSAWICRTDSAYVVRYLDAGHRPFLLGITRACRTVSTNALRVLAGALPAAFEIGLAVTRH